MTAKYEATQPTWIQAHNHLYRAGDVFETDETPSRTWNPLNAEAEAAWDAYVKSKGGKAPSAHVVMDLPNTINPEDAIIKKPTLPPDSGKAIGGSGSTPPAPRTIEDTLKPEGKK